MPSVIDENIRYYISLLVQGLTENPEAIVNLLDNMSYWQAGKTPSKIFLQSLSLRH